MAKKQIRWMPAEELAAHPEWTDEQIAQHEAVWKGILEPTAADREFDRWRFWSGLWEGIKLIPELIMGVSMYSNDPTIARDAIVYNADRAMRGQRQLHAAERQQDLAAREQERRQAQADEERRMRFLAREMAKEMVAEVNRQRPA